LHLENSYTVAYLALGIVEFAVVVFAFEIEGESLKDGVEISSRFGGWLNIICGESIHETI